MKGIQGDGAVPEFIPFALPDIGDDEIAAVVDCLRSGWVTTGNKAREFEQKFADYIGVEFALAVNSCTAALHLALDAIGVGAGDRVVTSPFTFTATAETIRYMGADPLFVDIDPDTMNMDPTEVQRAVEDNPGVKAILPVHFAGLACDMDVISNIAEHYDLRVIEDAAHALPTTFGGRPAGTLGDLGAFSFYATKTLCTGEGGMVVTNSKEFSERMRTMRLHGISRDVFDRYQSDAPSWYYEVVAPGYKYNMPDTAAALGVEQLRRLDSMQQRRTQISEYYDEHLRDLPLDLPPRPGSGDVHSWHLYVIRLNESVVNRNEFVELMAARSIGTSVHFIPLHVQPYWRERYSFSPMDFPEAFGTYSRCVSLPIYSRMSDLQVERTAEAVRAVLLG